MHIVSNEDPDLKTVIEMEEKFLTASRAKTLGNLREIIHTRLRYMSTLRTPPTSSTLTL